MHLVPIPVQRLLQRQQVLEALLSGQSERLTVRSLVIVSCRVYYAVVSMFKSELLCAYADVGIAVDRKL